MEIAPTTDSPSRELSAGQQAIAATQASDHAFDQHDETRTSGGADGKHSREDASRNAASKGSGRPIEALQSLSGEKRWDGEYCVPVSATWAQAVPTDRLGVTDVYPARIHFGL